MGRPATYTITASDVRRACDYLTTRHDDAELVALAQIADKDDRARAVWEWVTQNLDAVAIKNMRVAMRVQKRRELGKIGSVTLSREAVEHLRAVAARRGLSLSDAVLRLR